MSINLSCFYCRLLCVWPGVNKILIFSLTCDAFPPSNMMLQHFLIKGSCDVENLITHTATNTRLDSLSGTFCAQRCFIRKQTEIKELPWSCWCILIYELYGRQPFTSNNFFRVGERQLVASVEVQILFTDFCRIFQVRPTLVINYEHPKPVN